ncbi:MAG: Enoyl-[acyl-carrier-protein] reductase [NADH] FabI, partial [Candidatus Anoxychlamydiales bacterium]|nr:Enoyl-[acyl-carrier-protein] reductase [NADH] FabI [Candidatus Anoxychlamydiales bacterium]
MLKIDLKGKKAFIVGIADDQGFGFEIAKTLAEAGAEIIIGTWTPLVNIFEMSWRNKKFDESRKLKDGSLFEYKKIYPIDAAFDCPEDVPKDVLENKRYKNCSGYTISEVAKNIKNDFGNIDILVHSLANSPEITKSLLETSRKGYLSALSASSYSFVSLLAHLSPIMPENSAALALSYIASTRVIPGYGGAMSSAKAAL